MFSPRTPVSSTNKTDLQDITEILLKVALNTIIMYDYRSLTINVTQFIIFFQNLFNNVVC